MKTDLETMIVGLRTELPVQEIAGGPAFPGPTLTGFSPATCAGRARKPWRGCKACSARSRRRARSEGGRPPRMAFKGHEDSRRHAYTGLPSAFGLGAGLEGHNLPHRWEAFSYARLPREQFRLSHVRGGRRGGSSRLTRQRRLSSIDAALRAAPSRREPMLNIVSHSCCGD